MTYGLTTDGFVRKSLQTVKADIEAALETAFGVNNVRPHLTNSKSVWNKLVGALAQPYEELWELAEAVYNAMYPATSSGTSLANGCEMVGVVPKDAVKSTVQEVLEGVIGTTIVLGSAVATETIGDQFESTADVTLSDSVAVRANTALIGSVTNGKTYTITINGNAYSYVATVPSDDADDVGAGLKLAIDAGSDPVTVTDDGLGALQIDGDDDANGLPTAYTIAVNANVRIVTVGNLASFEGAEAGPVAAYADTLNSIVNPVSGWTAAWNPLDAVLGSLAETDSALRARRAASLATPGAGTVDAIRAGLFAIDEVTAVIVLENTTDVTDGEGLLPHSVEAIVENGDDDDIAEVLWERKGGGIYLNGTETVTVEDSQGIDQVIRFSRPAEVLIWVRLTYTLYDEEEFPANGETTIAATALATGNALGLGNDVLPDRFKGPVFDAVDGIQTLLVEVAEDVTGSPGAYQTTPMAIGYREVAVFDSGRISVVAA